VAGSRMELRQLRYFVKIAEMGSMSRASRALHISQPSLSQQIAQLEAELGKPLLIRIPSGVSVTIEGDAFYREAVQVLRHVDRLPEAVNRTTSGLTGRVSITLVHTQALQYALPLILKLRATCPGIELELFENTSSDALQGVASARRELGMLVNEKHAALVDSEPILEEELFLMSHPDQAPAQRSVTREQLLSIPMAVPSAAEVQSPLVDVLTSGAHNPRPIVANSVGIFRQAVLGGIAHTMQPWGVLRDDLLQGRVTATPVDPPVLRTVFLSTARDATLSEAARAVRQALISVIREQLVLGNVRARLLMQSEGEQH
jgi:LysR family transcriptional regulator, nitrogen assimilation regulatory protein